STRSSPRSRRPASPSAARRAPTTGSAKRPWRTGSVSVTSSTDLLRLVTCGSVDDGKSTLIGRLLYDTKQIFVDQMEHIEEASRRRGHDYVDLALLTDGLRAEREQGITIDVAYRSFVTPNRRFQLADAPGHVQYTRNMVTGASTADLAVILVDARNGVVEQTRRHAYITTILRVPHITVAVNKMDLVDWSQERYDEIVRDLETLGLADLHVIPMSALQGDNVVDRSENMPWYDGPRGNMLADPDRPPTAAREVEARVCWMSERPLEQRARLAVKHTTRSVRAIVDQIVSITDIQTLEEGPGPERLELNDIAVLRL